MLKFIMLEIVSDVRVLTRAYTVFYAAYHRGTMPDYREGMLILNKHTTSLSETLKAVNHGN